MSAKKILFCLSLFFCFSSCLIAQAQMTPNVYTYTDKNAAGQVYRLMIDEDYVVLTQFQDAPAKFIKTLGGFYKVVDRALHVQLEFNSNYETDTLKTMKIPFTFKEGTLVLTLDGQKEFTASPQNSQELDGKWLMAGRMENGTEQRRDTTAPRKTMKFLNNGHFQWIAFHTETMAFSGTGGGSFTSKDGSYTEHLEFFSRDASRVGAVLDFKYTLKGTDWHHTGKSSKGDPLHEIWAKRIQ